MLKLAGLGGFTYTINAWHSFAPLGLLALFAASAATIVGVFGSTSPAQRVGFGIAPKLLLINASVLSGSNLPATIRIALSG